MKIRLLIILLLLFKTPLFSQGVVNITGSCPLLKDGTEISLIKWEPRRFATFPQKIYTKISNHQFAFKVNAKNGEGYLLYINNRPVRFYLEPGKAHILIPDSTLNTITVTGNATGTAYHNFSLNQFNSAETKAYNQTRVKYLKYLEINDVDANFKGNLRKKVDSLNIIKQKNDLKLTLKYIEAHPSSYLNTLLLYNVIDEVSEDSVKNILRTIPGRNLNNTWGKELKYRVDSLFIGATAPGFEQTDTAGKKISLTNFRGKYLLIDFWASWCMPCRADNTNLITALSNYGSKNFTILSISLDANKGKWMQAIKQDKLSWTHLSDLNEWKNEVSVKYYVYAVPDNYLLDPDGKIIGKNLRGKDLLKKLKDLLDK